MKNSLDYFILFLIFAGLVLIGVKTLPISLERQERAECHEWQQEAKEYQGYYLAGWQKDQCDHWGIHIDTDVVR